MKAVMISVRPRWCELIVSGRKTVEVRKTRPKLDTPFRCYIYCTRCDEHRWDYDVVNVPKTFTGNGKVIGEFVCDDIRAHLNATRGGFKTLSRQSCVPEHELREYCGKRNYLDAWHISDLVIYDTPRELSKFSGRRCFYMERPPQNWCYVEEADHGP